jgi:anthranilate/para-aminobenzoate synthase component I
VQCLQRLQKFNGQEIISYGDGDEMFVAVGAESSLQLVQHQLEHHEPAGIERYNSPSAPWTKLNQFVEKHKGKYILGYLGFDMHNEKLQADYPVMFVMVPSLLISVQAKVMTSLVGNMTDDLTAEFSRTNCECDLQGVKKASELDLSNGEDYMRKVEQVLQWLKKENEGRLTIARTVPFEEKITVAKTLARVPGENALSRSFFVKVAGVEFAGQSPELLMQGDVKCFNTYKLSGTQQKVSTKNSAQEQEYFTNDQKIINEHKSSFLATRKSLQRLGQVTHGDPEILELPTLYHLMTVFETLPDENTTVTSCLKSVLPYGSHPLESGLKLLQQLETEPRGAYYGLVGMIEPMQNFSFCQIIRTVFKEKNECYFKVGAAITRDSTAAGEHQETKNKLSGVEVVLDV